MLIRGMAVNQGNFPTPIIPDLCADGMWIVAFFPNPMFSAQKVQIEVHEQFPFL